MIHTKKFGDVLKQLGYTFYSGVPCSLLKSLINYAINECKYVTATNEGEAVAIASGVTIGGEKSVVLMQNSGLTNATSPLISLNYIFKVPLLGFVSLRGEVGTSDEPQHELMGKITTRMLDLMKIKWEYLSTDFEVAKKQLVRANNFIESNQSFFFVVKKGTFDHQELEDEKTQSKQFILNQTKVLMNKNKDKGEEIPTRFDTLKTINALKDQKTVQIATTGKTGRELFEIEDGSNNLYMVGSMGCVSSLGLGLALAKNDKDIVVIDGDGALLMRMGSLATNGYYQPDNMLHILLDNQAYDSTGMQSTVSDNVNFVDLAAACGYDQSIYIHNLIELEEAIKVWKQSKGLTFLYFKVAKGSKEKLARPNASPQEIKLRLIKFLNHQID